jgi:branched-chain amino acid transport system permease protein
MDYFIILVASGLVVGATYGMIAMGFAFIYKATGVINFAQGELLLLTAYVAYSLAMSLQLSFFPLLAVTVPVAMLIGLLLERVFIRPMLGEPIFSIVMVTIGLAVIIRGTVVIVWGTGEDLLDIGFTRSVIWVGPVPFYEVQIYTAGTLAVLLVLAWGFFRFSRLGIAMRATANNQTAALLMGISTRKIYAVSWAIASGVAAVAGILVSAMFTINPALWFQGLKAFPAVILGGLDSVLGAAIGGLIIGVVENLAEGYIGHGVKEIAGFVVIILVLMVRPYGLFGQKDIERV